MAASVCMNVKDAVCVSDLHNERALWSLRFAWAPVPPYPRSFANHSTFGIFRTVGAKGGKTKQRIGAVIFHAFASTKVQIKKSCP